MTKIVFIEHNGKQYDVEAEDGRSLMQAALENGVRGILADCGGACSCATCHGYISKEDEARVGAPSEDEKAMLESAVHETAESRLTCQITVTPELEGLIVRLPVSQL